MGTFSYNTGRCDVMTSDGTRCKKILTNAGFAVKAHREMHLRAGELVLVTKWNWKGMPLETRMVEPRDEKFYAERGFFRTFEECKAFVASSRDVARGGK